MREAQNLFLLAGDGAMQDRDCGGGEGEGGKGEGRGEREGGGGSILFGKVMSIAAEAMERVKEGGEVTKGREGGGSGEGEQGRLIDVRMFNEHFVVKPPSSGNAPNPKPYALYPEPFTLEPGFKFRWQAD